MAVRLWLRGGSGGATSDDGDSDVAEPCALEGGERRVAVAAAGPAGGSTALAMLTELLPKPLLLPLLLEPVPAWLVPVDSSTMSELTCRRVMRGDGVVPALRRAPPDAELPPGGGPALASVANTAGVSAAKLELRCLGRVGLRRVPGPAAVWRSSTGVVSACAAAATGARDMDAATINDAPAADASTADIVSVS